MRRERLQARERFRNARFGMFIHWGIYSLLERGEWVMFHEKIPTTEYERLVARFNPVKFDANEWVNLAKQAGMRYITITAKHHDGFCMYDSQLTDYKITNTPFKRDVIREISDACRRARIALILYYSPLDWHHECYKSDWDCYTRYWHGQAVELVRKYKPFGIWLDGCWDKPNPLDANWKLTELYRALRALHPALLIANNHHQQPLPDEDIQTYEQDLPGENKAGFNPVPPDDAYLLETCVTINNSWGYNASDHQHKSVPQLIRLLAECAGKDANLLLNVGPKPDGTIQLEHIDRIRAVGKWLSRNRESIVGTRGRVFTATPWGSATRKENTIYLHIWNHEPGLPLVVDMPLKIRSARFVADKRRLSYRQTQGRLFLNLPQELPDSDNTVIRLEVSDGTF